MEVVGAGARDCIIISGNALLHLVGGWGCRTGDPCCRPHSFLDQEEVDGPAGGRREVKVSVSK